MSEIRERHGVQAVRGYVDVREDETHVTVALWDGQSDHHVRSAGLTPGAACYLAEQLYRLANRITARTRPNAAARQIAAAGGRARAANLSPERKSEIARKAAAARWNKGNDNGRE